MRFNPHKHKRAWTTQRVANRFPTWSRARDREDSTLQVLNNPMCLYFDEMFNLLIQSRDNYYVTHVDLNEDEQTHVTLLPPEFEFQVIRTSGGHTWQEPAVIGYDGTTEILIDIDNELGWSDLSRNYMAPTRATFSIVDTGVNDTVLTDTAISFLNTVTESSFDISGLNTMGHVYIDVDNCLDFGDVLDSGEEIKAKVVLRGEPQKLDQDELIREHVLFPTNTQKRTVNTWVKLSEVEMRGIYDINATVNLTLGFKKDFVPEPYAVWVDNISSQGLMYEVGTVDIGSTVSVLKYVSLELGESELLEQGYGERIVNHELLLWDTQTASFLTGLVAIDRSPFSFHMAAVNQDKLYLFSPHRPGLSSYEHIYSDFDSQALMQMFLKSRTPTIELAVEPDGNALMPSDSGSNTLWVYSHHVGHSRSIIRTRWSVISYDAGSGAFYTTYYDNSGNVVDPLTDPNQGFVMNEIVSKDPDDWNEIRLGVNLFDFDVPCAVVALESQVSGEVIQKDAAFIYMDILPVETSFDLPVGLQGNVDGLAYNHEQKLMILSTSGDIWETDFSYDYAVVDYEAKAVYFKELYDSVRIASSGTDGTPSGDLISPNGGDHVMSITVGWAEWVDQEIEIYSWHGVPSTSPPTWTTTIPGPGTYKLYLPRIATDPNVIIGLGTDSDGDTLIDLTTEVGSFATDNPGISYINGSL